MSDSSDRVRNVSEQVLADDYYVLRKASFELQRADGTWVSHQREAYDRGNGAVDRQRLYQLIRQTGPIVDHLLEIEFLDAGAEAFSFTFG